MIRLCSLNSLLCKLCLYSHWAFINKGILIKHTTYRNFHILMQNLILLLLYSLFTLGLVGLIVRWDNVLITLICLEIMLLSVAVLFLIYSYLIDDIVGQLIYVYILILAGVEVAIGLSILIVYYRLRGVISVRFISLLKG